MLTRVLLASLLLTGTAIPQRRAAPRPAAPDPFANASMPIQGLLQWTKFHREALQNDKLVQYFATFMMKGQGDCAAARVFSNEFDGAAATATARRNLEALLDRKAPVIQASIDFDLGAYDRQMGAFPVGLIYGDGKLHDIGATVALTPVATPAHNVGAYFSNCYIDPFPRIRVQIQFVPGNGSMFRWLKMSEADGRAYVQNHPGTRKITVRIDLNLTGAHEEPNDWRPDPARILILDGQFGASTVTDYSTHRPVPGQLIIS